MKWNWIGIFRLPMSSYYVKKKGKGGMAAMPYPLYGKGLPHSNNSPNVICLFGRASRRQQTHPDHNRQLPVEYSPGIFFGPYWDGLIGEKNVCRETARLSLSGFWPSWY